MSARILVLDIETTPNLAYVWGLWKQNVAINQLESTTELLSLAWKWHGEKAVGYADNRDGQGLLRDTVHGLLDLADVVVHWNGTSFDIPHLQRELLEGGYEPPSPFKQVDLMLQVRKHFRFTSNKLDHVAQQLGVGKKTQHTGFTLWRKCMAGDEAAWKLMRKYNMQDVVLTDQLYTRLLPWLSGHPHLGLFVTGNVCGRCAGKLQRRGIAYTNLGSYHRLQCTKCKSWSRAKAVLSGVDARPV